MLSEIRRNQTLVFFNDLENKEKLKYELQTNIFSEEEKEPQIERILEI